MWQTVPGIARSLILIGRAQASFNKWLRPILPRRAARRTGVPSRDPMGSRWGSDHTLVTVDDVSPLLDRSGCRMLMSLSASEG